MLGRMTAETRTMESVQRSIKRAEMHRVMPSIKGISWDRLVAENSVTYPVESLDVPGEDVIFSDGFPTTSGRADI